MELSKNYWLICFASDGARHRQVTVSSGHVKELLRHISLAKEKFGLKEDAPVYSCFEAGRDGFWIHRMLEQGCFTCLWTERYCPTGAVVFSEVLFHVLHRPVRERYFDLHPFS